MNEILTYIGENRRRATIGYELDGKMIRLFRKLDGADRQAVEDAIQHVRNKGVDKVVIEVYRPNGNAMVLAKKFYLPNGKDLKEKSDKSLGNPTLFDLPMTNDSSRMTNDFVKAAKNKPQPTKSMESNTTSWKDYALKSEQEKVAKLEAEVKRLSIKNESLDSKVREFEKEMIKKDHEIEKFQGQVESKSGLSGFVEKASENPAMMNFLAGIGSRLFGMPEVGSHAALNAPASMNPQTEQYITNISTWLQKQPMELQDQFYQLVHAITNTSNVSENISKLINLINNGTLIKRTA
ncbi:MAG TPA: hypothetical protein VIM65_15830 [Cyclobacteriaceae bacterium]